MNKLNKFRTRLMQALKNRKMTPAILSQLTDLHPATIYRYISGERIPSIDQVSKIADALNVDPAWLMGYDVQADYTFKLNEQDAVLVEKLRQLDPEDKQHLEFIIDQLLKKGKANK